MSAERAKTAILFTLLVLAMGLPSALGQFSITYYDNYNYDTGQWDNWDFWAAPQIDRQSFWNDEYEADFTTGNTEQSAHFRSAINEFDLRTGFGSLDTHSTNETFTADDWTPLKSIGDPAWYGEVSSHHIYAAKFEGMVYFEAGDVLSIESDDDSYIFLDDNTAWDDAILSDPGSHPFEEPYPTMSIPAELAGFHRTTVKFADTHEVQCGIRITVNGQALRAVLVATVRIEPETLNLGSNGVITAFIELAADYSVAQIDVSTVRCAGAGAVKGTVAGDTLIVKFNCQDLQDLTAGEAVALEVAGQFTDGRWFYGVDTVRVIDPSAASNKGKKK